MWHFKGRKVGVFANICMKIKIALCCDVLHLPVSVRAVTNTTYPENRVP